LISEDRNFHEIILIAIIDWSVRNAHDERAEPGTLILRPAFLPDRAPGADHAFESCDRIISRGCKALPEFGRHHSTPVEGSSDER
jgi:hypothetical protein